MHKKIGILTLYYNNYNFGGLLQAYALQKFIDAYKLDCEQICFDGLVTEQEIRLCRIKNQSGFTKLKGIIRFYQFKINEVYLDIRNLPIKRRLENRLNEFKRFQQLIPHSKNVFVNDTIEQTLELYNTFICGSDVIWNAGISEYISCLGFVPDNYKKFSYAPSLGGDELPTDWISKYKSYLSNLDAVSVREKSIKECINKEIPNLDISVVVDPTLLLTKKDWIEILPHNKLSENYVFCYLLGSNKEQRKRIKMFAKKFDLIIVSLPHISNNKYRCCDEKFGDVQDYSSGPDGFVQLIKNADIVITDSYHAVVFSLLFHVNFRVINRFNGNKSTIMNGRVKNLLQEMEFTELLIQNEMIDKIDFNKKLDFNLADLVIEKKRKKSAEYLSNQLVCK